MGPPESASADALADWLADPIGPDRIRSDPIGSAADPPRTKSADYSPEKLIRHRTGEPMMKILFGKHKDIDSKIA